MDVEEKEASLLDRLLVLAESFSKRLRFSAGASNQKPELAVTKPQKSFMAVLAALGGGAALLTKPACCQTPPHALASCPH